MVKCPGAVSAAHAVAPQPPADAEVGEEGTCTYCGCRYQVVGVHPTVLARAYDAYVEALHAHLGSMHDALREVLDRTPQPLPPREDS